MDVIGKALDGKELTRYQSRGNAKDTSFLKRMSNGTSKVRTFQLVEMSDEGKEKMILGEKNSSNYYVRNQPLIERAFNVLLKGIKVGSAVIRVDGEFEMGAHLEKRFSNDSFLLSSNCAAMGDRDPRLIPLEK